MEDIVGEVTVTDLASGEQLLTDEAGHTWLWPAPPPGPHLIDFIDPRIDLCSPIYEQVQRLAAEDETSVKAVRDQQHTAA